MEGGSRDEHRREASYRAVVLEGDTGDGSEVPERHRLACRRLVLHLELEGIKTGSTSLPVRLVLGRDPFLRSFAERRDAVLVADIDIRPAANEGMHSLGLRARRQRLVPERTEELQGVPAHGIAGVYARSIVEEPGGRVHFVSLNGELQ